MKSLQQSHSNEQSLATADWIPSGLREQLALLWHFQGTDPDFALATTATLTRLLAVIGLLFGAPSALYRTLQFPETSFGIAGSIAGSLALVMLWATTLLPKRWGPAVGSALLVVVAVLIAARNGSLSIGATALMFAVTLVFISYGTRVTLAYISAYAFLTWTVLPPTWSSAALIDALFFALNLACLLMFLSMLYVLHERILSIRRTAEANFTELDKIRDNQYRAISLLTQELRAPATSIFMLTQDTHSAHVIRDDLGKSLEYLDIVVSDLQAASGIDGDLPHLKRAFRLDNLLFDVTQQISPLMSGRDIAFSVAAVSETGTSYELDAIRIRGIAFALCRAAMLIDRVRQVKFSADIVSGESTEYAVLIELQINDMAHLAEEISSLQNDPSHTGDLGSTWRELKLVRQWLDQLAGQFMVTADEQQLKLDAWIPIDSEESHDGNAANAQGTVSTASLQGKHVLVVDDDATTRYASARLLRNTFGARVTDASDGEEAWRVFVSEGDIDLVLTDYLMPGGNGDVLINKIRAQHPHMWLVMATGSASPEQVDSLRNKGASLVLPKPISAELISRSFDFLSHEREAKPHGS